MIDLENDHSYWHTPPTAPEVIYVPYVADGTCMLFPATPPGTGYVLLFQIGEDEERCHILGATKRECVARWLTTLA